MTVTKRSFLSLIPICALLWTVPGAMADSGNGRVKCEILENGESASGTLAVERDGKPVASGSCGKELSLPPGSYTAVVRLDGALDGPEVSQPLEVSKGVLSQIKADFATGTLEVRVQRQGRRAAGMALLEKDGKRIGTLGGGVSAHLSTGSYRVVARYRSQEKVFDDVRVRPGAPVVLTAEFE